MGKNMDLQHLYNMNDLQIMAVDHLNLQDIMKKFPQRVRFYPLKNSVTMSGSNVLMWGRDDPEEFLSMFTETGNNILYYFQPPMGEKSRDESEYFELAFISNGFLHVFTNIGHPPVSDSGAVSSTVKGNSGQTDLLNRNPDELADEMANFVSMNLDYMSPDTFNLQYFYKKFWSSLGINPDLPAGSDLRRMMDKIESMTTRKIKSRS